MDNLTNPYVLLNYQPPLHHEITLVGSKVDIAAPVNDAKISSAAPVVIARMIVVPVAIAKAGAVPAPTEKEAALPAAIAKAVAPLATTVKAAIEKMIAVLAAIVWAAMASPPHQDSALASR